MFALLKSQIILLVAYEIAVPFSFNSRKNSLCKIKKLINLLLVFLYLVIFLKLVNELKKDFRKAQAFFFVPCVTEKRQRQDTLQKGGVPATPSGTATLLRLSPNYQFRPRPLLAVADFRRPRLSWLDGRCVQGPGTYSPRHG